MSLRRSSRSGISKKISDFKPSPIEYDEFELKLIKLVEKHPLIYDESHPQYGSQSLLRLAWKDISQKMGFGSLFTFFVCLEFP